MAIKLITAGVHEALMNRVQCMRDINALYDDQVDELIDLREHCCDLPSSSSSAADLDVPKIFYLGLCLFGTIGSADLIRVNNAGDYPWIYTGNRQGYEYRFTYNGSIWIFAGHNGSAWVNLTQSNAPEVGAGHKPVYPTEPRNRHLKSFDATPIPEAGVMSPVHF